MSPGLAWLVICAGGMTLLLAWALADKIAHHIAYRRRVARLHRAMWED